MKPVNGVWIEWNFLLTLMVLKPQLTFMIRTIACLLMSLSPLSPGHQRPMQCGSPMNDLNYGTQAWNESITLWNDMDWVVFSMGLLPDTQNCGLRMCRECRERFPPPPNLKETDSERSRHASRHVRHARAVMHVGIAYPRWRGKRSRHSRRMRICNFAYLVRGPWVRSHLKLSTPAIVSPMFLEWWLWEYEYFARKINISNASCPRTRAFIFDFKMDVQFWSSNVQTEIKNVYYYTQNYIQIRVSEW